MRLTLFFLFSLGFSLNLQAQQNSPLYNGREFVPFTLPTTGNAYFKNGSKVDENWIKFDKVLYQAPLLFDLKNNDVITRHPVLLNNIIVVKELVDYFTIDSDTIRNLNENGLKPGFYVQIFNSPLYKSYAKYSKNIHDPKSTNEKRFYTQSVEYFYTLPQKNAYYPYKNINKIIAEYPLHKKELKALIRQNPDDNLETQTQIVFDYLNSISSSKL